jgi:hypothetical protein
MPRRRPRRPDTGSSAGPGIHTPQRIDRPRRMGPRLRGYDNTYLSWPALCRPSRLGGHFAFLSGITGPSPVMTTAWLMRRVFLRHARTCCGIHVFLFFRKKQGVDCRVKAGDDGGEATKMKTPGSFLPGAFVY